MKEECLQIHYVAPWPMTYEPPMPTDRYPLIVSYAPHLGLGHRERYLAPPPDLG